MKRRMLVLMAAVALTLGLPAASWAVGGGRDCDDNAILYCGAYTQSELLNKIAHGDSKHSAASLQAIYDSRGMTTAIIKQTVDGTSDNQGNVFVNGRIVATGAKSDGRQKLAASSVKDGSLWLTPNQDAFKSTSIQAFVYMKNGVFQWAILKSCGNTLIAKPKPTPTPVPTPTPTPVPTPTPTPTPQIPQTGPVGPVAGALGLTGLTMAGRTYLRSRKALQQAQRAGVDKTSG